MSASLLHATARDLAPDDYLRCTAALLDAVRRDGRPRLTVATLTGRALLLGRHQRAASALKLDAAAREGAPVLRRLSGGRALHVGEGIVVAALALPNASALLDGAVPPSKVLNRHVRAVIAAGSALGLPVHYFGRDFLTLAQRQGGYCAFEVRPGGEALVELFLAATAELAVPEGLEGYPTPETAPPPHTRWSEHRRDVTPAMVAEAVADGFRRALNVALEPAAMESGGALLETGWSGDGFATSGLGDIPIGFLEAWVKRDGERIGEAKLTGDFMCPAHALAAFEDALRGQPLEFAALGELTDAHFRANPPFGLRELRIIPDALLEAGKGA